MEEPIKRALEAAGDPSEVTVSRAVSGGSINQAYYIQTKENEYFIKLNQNVPTDFFQREVDGLALIRDSATVTVPDVYYYNQPKPGESGILVLQWVPGGKRPNTTGRLGRELAQLHQTYGEGFGLADDNYVGELKQPNGWHKSWVSYYRNQRLKTQIDLAEKLGRMPVERRRKAERLMERLDEFLPRNSKPSLLHGDLWGGNFMAGNDGEPILIDPAVFYGHYEMEMAFTELFGGFAQDFYDEYREALPLGQDYQDRKPIYQLFYLLVHLNIFGGAYGASVDRVLDRYVGT